MIGISIHYVERIELSSRFDSNNGSRTIRIVQEDGTETEIMLYGKTEVIDALPKAANFKDYI